jgi:hypothetical protein
MILTCDHRNLGLCPACRADYEEDPQAFEQFGCHPEGRRRWAELQAEFAADWAAEEERVRLERLAAEPAPEPYRDDEIPF